MTSQTTATIKPYGYCPECFSPCMERERSPNGRTRCTAGHTFPHAMTLPEKPGPTPSVPAAGKGPLAPEPADLHSHPAFAVSTLFYDLRAAVHSLQHELGFPADDPRISLSYRANELAGEVGEACNVVKKLDREKLGIVGSRATLDQLAEELADAMICLDNLAWQAGICLDTAVRLKFNRVSRKMNCTTRIVETWADPIIARRTQPTRGE